MSKKPTLSDITNILTAGTVINSNNKKIETSFENTISRDGSTPNEMGADLDMNSNDILNAGTIDAQDLLLNGTTITDSAANAVLAQAWAESPISPDGVPDSKSAKTWAGEAQGNAEALAPYASRAVAEASSPLSVVLRLGILTPEGLSLWYVYDAAGTALTTADGRTWSPDGVIRPEHFAENTEQGVTDMGGAINAAVAYGPTKLSVGIYATSVEIPLIDGKSLTGEGAFWKRRTSYIPSGVSIIKYIGATGALTAVVRISEKEVGVVGSGFGVVDTPDVVSVTAHDFHVDANGANYGIYVYRAGNQSTIGNLTAEGAARANHIHMGCYAAYFGHFGAYESENVGVLCGFDEFGWGGVEYTNFAYRASFHLVNNGTAGTFVEDSATDLDGCGGIFVCGRGSVITLTSEGNAGRAYYAKTYPIGGGEGGSLTIEADYIEANGAGPKLIQTSDDGGLLVQNGFVHPGNGGSLAAQTIKIEAQNISGVVTDDEGSEYPEQWVVLRNLHGGMVVNSNTDRYRVDECDKDTLFLDRRPTDPYNKMQNMSINGDLSVWQRGTTFSADGYTADRLYLDLSGATGTVTQQALTTGILPGYNAPSLDYFAQLDVTTGNADAGFIHKTADVRKFAGCRMIVSFWAKSDTLKSYRVTHRQNFGSGGSAAVETFAGDIDVGTSWQRFSLAMDLESISGKTIGADNYFGLRIRRTAADTFTLSIAGLAIERGTWGPCLFQQKPYAEELANCLPYFQRIVSGTGIRMGCAGQAISATSAIFGVDYITPMRKVPTLSLSSVSHFATSRSTAADEPITSIALSQSGVNSGRLVAGVATGLVAGNATLMTTINAAATLDLVAEV